MIKLWLSSVILLLPFSLTATDFSPWLTRDFEIETRGTALYQTYNKVDTPDGDLHHRGDDRFYTLSAEGTLSCVPMLDMTLCGFNAEFETTIADTHHQHPCIDNFRLTMRYRLFDDVMDEDPFTLVAGATMTQAFKHSLHDISSFHHGQIEGELHVTIGKEEPCMEYWFTRKWAVFGVGMGDIGSVWFRGDAVWERNWYEQHQLRFFLHSLWGLGGDNISLMKPFRGYGPINHQSVDLGTRYTYIFCNYATISFEYTRRVYAKNFPDQANLYLISYMYPFGL